MKVKSSRSKTAPKQTAKAVEPEYGAGVPDEVKAVYQTFLDKETARQKLADDRKAKGSTDAALEAAANERNGALAALKTAVREHPSGGSSLALAKAQVRLASEPLEVKLQKVRSKEGALASVPAWNERNEKALKALVGALDTAVDGAVAHASLACLLLATNLLHTMQDMPWHHQERCKALQNLLSRKKESKAVEEMMMNYNVTSMLPIMEKQFNTMQMIAERQKPVADDVIGTDKWGFEELAARSKEYLDSVVENAKESMRVAMLHLSISFNRSTSLLCVPFFSQTMVDGGNASKKADTKKMEQHVEWFVANRDLPKERFTKNFLFVPVADAARLSDKSLPAVNWTVEEKNRFLQVETTKLSKVAEEQRKDLRQRALAHEEENKVQDRSRKATEAKGKKGEAAVEQGAVEAGGDESSQELVKAGQTADLVKELLDREAEKRKDQGAVVGALRLEMSEFMRGLAELESEHALESYEDMRDLKVVRQWEADNYTHQLWYELSPETRFFTMSQFEKRFKLHSYSNMDSPLFMGKVWQLLKTRVLIGEEISEVVEAHRMNANALRIPPSEEEFIQDEVEAVGETTPESLSDLPTLQEVSVCPTTDSDLTFYLGSTFRRQAGPAEAPGAGQPRKKGSNGSRVGEVDGELPSAAPPLFDSHELEDAVGLNSAAGLRIDLQYEVDSDDGVPSGSVFEPKKADRAGRLSQYLENTLTTMVASEHLALHLWGGFNTLLKKTVFKMTTESQEKSRVAKVVRAAFLEKWGSRLDLVARFVLSGAYFVKLSCKGGSKKAFSGDELDVYLHARFSNLSFLASFVAARFREVSSVDEKKLESLTASQFHKQTDVGVVEFCEPFLRAVLDPSWHSESGDRPSEPEQLQPLKEAAIEVAVMGARLLVARGRLPKYAWETMMQWLHFTLEEDKEPNEPADIEDRLVPHSLQREKKTFADALWAFHHCGELSLKNVFKLATFICALVGVAFASGPEVDDGLQANYLTHCAGATLKNVKSDVSGERGEKVVLAATEAVHNICKSSATDAGLKALRTAASPCCAALWAARLRMDEKASVGPGSTVKLKWLPSGYVARPRHPEDRSELLLEAATMDATSYVYLMSVMDGMAGRAEYWLGNYIARSVVPLQNLLQSVRILQKASGMMDSKQNSEELKDVEKTVQIVRMYAWSATELMQSSLILREAVVTCTKDLDETTLLYKEKSLTRLVNDYRNVTKRRFAIIERPEQWVGRLDHELKNVVRKLRDLELGGLRYGTQSLHLDLLDAEETLQRCVEHMTALGEGVLRAQDVSRALADAASLNFSKAAGNAREAMTMVPLSSALRLLGQRVLPRRWERLLQADKVKEEARKKEESDAASASLLEEETAAKEAEQKKAKKRAAQKAKKAAEAAAATAEAAAAKKAAGGEEAPAGAAAGDKAKGGMKKDEDEKEKADAEEDGNFAQLFSHLNFKRETGIRETTAAANTAAAAEASISSRRNAPTGERAKARLINYSGSWACNCSRTHTDIDTACGNCGVKLCRPFIEGKPCAVPNNCPLTHPAFALPNMPALTLKRESICVRNNFNAWPKEKQDEFARRQAEVRSRMRIVSWQGDWICQCKTKCALRDTCPNCKQPPPCRDAVRGACKLGKVCRFPHLPVDLKPESAPPKDRRMVTIVPGLTQMYAGRGAPAPPVPGYSEKPPPAPKQRNVTVAVVGAGKKAAPRDDAVAAAVAAASATQRPPPLPMQQQSGASFDQQHPDSAMWAAPQGGAAYNALGSQFNGVLGAAGTVPSAAGWGGLGPTTGDIGPLFGTPLSPNASGAAAASLGHFQQPYGGYGAPGQPYDSAAFPGTLSHATSSALSSSTYPPSDLEALGGAEVSAQPEGADEFNSMLADLGVAATWKNALTVTVGPEDAAVLSMAAPGLANATGEYNCFLNVVIQCLWSCAEFRRRVMAWSPDLYTADPVVEALRDLFDAFAAQEEERAAVPALGFAEFKRERAVVNPAPLREALAGLPGGGFELGEMNDAAELLMTLFSCAHEVGPAGAVAVDRTFGLRVKEFVRCTNCKSPDGSLLETHVNEYVQYFFNVSATALRMVRQSFGAAETTGQILRRIEQQTQKSCDTEKGGCDAKLMVRHALDTPPAVFTLQLAWESNAESNQDIHETLRSVQESIKLEDVYADVVSLDCAVQPYRLRSAVAYYGAHYTAFVLSTKLGCWVQFDDTNVHRIGRWQDVIAKCQAGRIQPSVLFYETE